jgi:crotonobetainyl-CoA:carnitine CoA-transferase CaiB-like acyl-CoA transferase
MPTTICTGLNVLEMGSGSIGASLAGQVLADAGARVVKVEPREGDRLRAVNPNGFLVWNRGKESLVADLRSPGGQEAVREQARGVDVVLEGFAPGRTESWGVGADALCGADPRLIHCSITGFGPVGPYAHLKGYDSLVAAKVGLWGRGAFGHRDGPMMYPVAWGSFGAATQTVAGVLAALMVRDATGRGQRLYATLVAGLDPVDYFVSTIVQLMAKQGDTPTGDARSAMAASRYGVLAATRDGRFIQTSTLLPHQGRALCEVAGIAHLLDEPRFSRAPMFDNADDAQAWEDLLLESFRTQDLDYWLPKLMASPDVAFEIAVTSEQGLEHPQIVHNGDVLTVDDPDVGPVREVGPIGHFSTTPLQVDRSAPRLGKNDGSFKVKAVASPARSAARAVQSTPPWEGVTIVEFGYFYAMPYALAMAASLGARVIKLEDGKGDPHRQSFGPEVASMKTTAGKESVSIDLQTPEGRAFAQRVVAGADVFVNGFRSGVAEKLGLGEADLRALKPPLLYVHAAGYGSTGPYAQRALYAQAAQAVAGSFGRQVGYWLDPERNLDMSVMELQAVVIPRLANLVDGDSNAALALFASLALGIYHQRRTGEGQRLETSMIGGNAWAYADDFCSYAGKPPVPLCDSESYGISGLDRLYRAAAGSWVCLCVRSETEYRALADGLDLHELVSDARFSTAEARAENDAALTEVLGERFAEDAAAAWEAKLSKLGVGCVEANLQGQPVVTSFDPVLRETGLTVTIDHPLFGEMTRAAPPILFSETPGRVAPPCLRGQHNRSVAREIGYSDEEIARLESAGALIPPDAPPPG